MVGLLGVEQGRRPAFGVGRLKNSGVNGGDLTDSPTMPHGYDSGGR